MFLNYENKRSNVAVEWKKTTHFPPHLHEAIEMVYVTEGTLELGVEQELYHMEKGDFGIIFPNTIHHYQAFGGPESKALYLLVSPKLIPGYLEEMQKCTPKMPVIKKESLHADIVKAVRALTDVDKDNNRLIQAYVQMIIAHIFSEIEMVERGMISGADIVYRVVEYVARNFRGKITLDKMAYDLGVSKYGLSRLFSKIFHCNFTTYVNGVRLNYAVSMLDNTGEAIATICHNCGFDSQRTFNRVFKERYKITPRDYRERT